jgi:predicted transcriptional regulator
MAGSDLTAKQQQALDAFKDGGDVKDVAKVMGISTAGAHSHIAALKKKGFIDGENRLTTKAVIGRVAGAPEAEAAKPEAPEAPAVAVVHQRQQPRHESFNLDQQIAEQFGLRRQELATTIETIEHAFSIHEQRVSVLDAERVEHDESMKRLTEARDQAQKALSALPVEQTKPVAA